MKKKIVILLIIVVGALVAVCGCNNSNEKEILLKEINVASLPSNRLFRGHDALVDIPDNATKVRVVYSLTGSNSYGTGSNGNIGEYKRRINP